MKIVYWGGGIGDIKLSNLRWIDGKAKNAPGFPKLPDFRNLDVLVLHNLLGGVDLTPSEHQDFVKIAEPALRDLYKSRTASWKNLGMTKWRKKSQDPAVKTFRDRYEKVIEGQQKNAKDLYDSVDKLLKREMPNVPVLVFAGPNDTKDIADVFGDRFVNGNVVSVGDVKFAGIAALEHQDLYLAQRNWIKPTGKEERFLRSKDAVSSDVFISSEFIEGHYAPYLGKNGAYSQQRLGVLVDHLVRERWSTDGARRKMNKLAVTPADRKVLNTEVSQRPGAFILNAGKDNLTDSLYVIQFGERGAEAIQGEDQNGRSRTVHRASCRTYTADDVKTYPPVTKHDMTTRMNPGTVYEQKTKHETKVARRLKRAKNVKQLETLVDDAPGIKKLIKSAQNSRRQYKEIEAQYGGLLRESRGQKREYNSFRRNVIDLFNNHAADMIEDDHEDKKAMKFFRSALGIVPKSKQDVRGVLEYNLGACYFNLGQYKTALEHYDHARQLFPRDKTIAKEYRRCEKLVPSSKR